MFRYVEYGMIGNIRRPNCAFEAEMIFIDTGINEYMDSSFSFYLVT